MAAGSSKEVMTVEEVVSTLSHSFLPTVILEGEDDLIVFRRLETKFAELELSLFPVGGRHAVLRLFDRRSELPGTVAFIADMDLWVMTGVPEDYVSDRLLFTTGYSIENDVFVDGNLEKLLSREEAPRFAKELSTFLDWYALALSRHFKDSSQSIELHANQVLDDAAITAKLTTLADGEEYPHAIREALKNNYARLLRGKSLIGVLMRHLSYGGRPVRHNSKSLADVVAASPGPLLVKFYIRIEEIFLPAKARA